MDEATWRSASVILAGETEVLLIVFFHRLPLPARGGMNFCIDKISTLTIY
jgi:hypothetical protein